MPAVASYVMHRRESGIDLFTLTLTLTLSKKETELFLQDSSPSLPLMATESELEFCPLKKLLKVCVKEIQRFVSKRIKYVRKSLPKTRENTVNYVLLNCGVRSFNNFSPFLFSGFSGRV